MEVYQTLTLMISFATLVVLILSFHKKTVYRRTFTEDRPRLEDVFLAIIEWVQLR
jgi:hypothetical protein